MVDAVEDLIRGELGRLATPVADRTPDWNNVRACVPDDRRPITALRIALAVAVAVAVVLPAVAFSSGVRSFLGIESPRPRFDQAHLAVAAPLPDGRVAHLWVSPSSTGGDCLFVTFDPQRLTPRPSRMLGGGGCSLRPEPHAHVFDWSLSRGIGRTPTVLSGRIDPRLHPARVVLRWHGGFRAGSSRNGYFIAVDPLLKNPPFRLLPLDIVAFNKKGRTVSTSRIPSSFLYSNWKREEPKLRVYRRAHGCSTTVVWRCRSR
jgi:hypothetical protein